MGGRERSCAAKRCHLVSVKQRGESQTWPQLPSHNHSQYSCFFLSLSPFQLCHNSSMFATQSLPLFVCLSLSLSLSLLFNCERGLPRGSSGGGESDRKKHGKWAIWMKLPLILQLLVQPHILFCSVVVGSGHCFGATSNVTGANGLLQCCQRPRPRRETMTTLFTAFYEKNLASRHTNNHEQLLVACEKDHGF